MSRRPRTRAGVLYEHTIRQALQGHRSRRARRILRRNRAPAGLISGELSDMHWTAVLAYEEREERRWRATFDLPRYQQLHRCFPRRWRP